MFTGIIEETGIVRTIESTEKSTRLTVEATNVARDLKRGDSVAVNGCCLTVVGLRSQGTRKRIQFDLLHETWTVTNLQFTRPGSLVNLERPLVAGGRLDGNFVTGHIDTMGTFTGWERVGKDHQLDIRAPREVQRLVVPKGSIALDGISLTIARVLPRGFRIWIIPHTYAVTALRERRVGDAVNLEADILGKYVAKFAADARSRK
jgi:riboflavin synthase